MVDKSVLVLNLSKNKIFIPKNFSYLNIERKKIIRNILAKGIKEGNLRSIIIDDQNTNDKGDIAKIWKDLGGSVVIQASLEKQLTSQKLLSKILLLEQSENRSRKLSREISLALEHEPRRRKDVDLFIISTNLKTSRSLKPALDYNLANSLPVYLIPEWGEKENLKEKEIDLESSFITGMSLMLNARINPLNMEEIRKSQGFAAGYDAFELAVLLNNQKKISYLGMMGLISNKTEKLELTPLIGKIKKGKIEFLHPID
jgi:outer membrane PBP1 activator LpoA protein